MTQILTHTGKLFDLALPDANLIDPRDISHALAQICRFNGHTRTFYSVAQHSCIVADLVPNEHKLAALLHDAPQAYLGDLVRPLKRFMFSYQHTEDLVWQAICGAFGVDTELPQSVLLADLTALATERRDLLPAHPAVWECLEGIEPMADVIRPWTALEARTHYSQRLMDQLSINNRRNAA